MTKMTNFLKQNWFKIAVVTGLFIIAYLMFLQPKTNPFGETNRPSVASFNEDEQMQIMMNFIELGGLKANKTPEEIEQLKQEFLAIHSNQPKNLEPITTTAPSPYYYVNWQPVPIDSSVDTIKCNTQQSTYNFGLVTDFEKIRAPLFPVPNLFPDTLIYNLKSTPKLKAMEGGAVFEFTDVGSNDRNIKNYIHKGQKLYALMTIYKPYGVVIITYHDEVTGLMGDKDFLVDSSIYTCRPA